MGYQKSIDTSALTNKSDVAPLDSPAPEIASMANDKGAAADVGKLFRGRAQNVRKHNDIKGQINIMP